MRYPSTKEAKLKALRKLAQKYNCEQAVEFVLSHPSFPIWTAAPAKKCHHYGKGGLLQHTLEVTKLAEAMALALPHTLNMKVLITAAIFHDIGKLSDYAPIPETDYHEWESTREKFLIYHITNSVLLFEKHGAKFFNTEEVLQIKHCVLAHHGHYEWKSPALPCTREAMVLHLADMASARCEDLHLNEPWKKYQKENKNP